jgi:hypothetical protein
MKRGFKVSRLQSFKGKKENKIATAENRGDIDLETLKL